MMPVPSPKSTTAASSLVSFPMRRLVNVSERSYTGEDFMKHCRRQLAAANLHREKIELIEWDPCSVRIEKELQVYDQPQMDWVSDIN